MVEAWVAREQWSLGARTRALRIRWSLEVQEALGCRAEQCDSKASKLRVDVQLATYICDCCRYKAQDATRTLILRDSSIESLQPMQLYHAQTTYMPQSHASTQRKKERLVIILLSISSSIPASRPSQLSTKNHHNSPAGIIQQDSVLCDACLPAT